MIFFNISKYTIYNKSNEANIHCEANRSTEMAEGRMNLAALQQRDPYITDIVDTASQVALYSFSKDMVSWVGVDSFLDFACTLSKYTYTSLSLAH